MALTLRTNGSSGVNLVTAQWWNDYYNLLTGSMTDQIVTLKTDVILQSILSGTIAAPTLATAAGTTLGVGAYGYFVTFVDNNGGETYVSYATTASITTTTSNTNVALSAIPTGPTGTVKRNIYRTKVGGSTYYLLATISDNTTTTYTDSIADTSLVTSPPSHPSFGGSLSIKNNSAAVKGQWFSDGSISLDGGTVYTNGLGTMFATQMYLVSGAHWQWNNSTLAVEQWTPQSGSANGHAFTIWNGSAAVKAFSIGGQFESALAYVDGSGNFTGGNFTGLVVTAQGSGTGNDDLVLLTRTANTTQTIKLGVDNTGAFYAYDANAANYIFQGLKGGLPLTTNRNGTNTAVAVYTGANTPSGNGTTTPPTGAIWIKA